tara:strand:+ start:288 stop:818 length:531 start_codon:yes stop_codon:yes gene_type:complete
MDPISIGFAVGGAILGKIGMNKRRREERRRRARERVHAINAQKSLISSIGGLRQDYKDRAGFGRQEFSIRQQGAIQGYQGERSAMDSLVGSTGLSYGGGAQEQSNRLDSSFKTQLSGQRLGAEQQMSSLTQGFESDLRGVQVGLLNLEQTASQRGYSIPSMGANFNTSPSGLGGTV